MEVIIELSKEEAERLHISVPKLTFDELKRKMAMADLSATLEESHKIAKKYGIDTMSMEEINQLIKEAKAAYNDKSNH